MHNEVEYVTPKTRLRGGANRGKEIGGQVIRLTFVEAASADPKYVRFRSDTGKVYTFERTFAERLLRWGESEKRAKAIAEAAATPKAPAKTEPEPAATATAEAPKAPAKPRSVRKAPAKTEPEPAAS